MRVFDHSCRSCMNLSDTIDEILDEQEREAAELRLLMEVADKARDRIEGGSSWSELRRALAAYDEFRKHGKESK